MERAIGIREKFGNEFLFEEFHWDTGPPFGTVNPKEELGMLPDDIELSEDIGTIDGISRRPVVFEKSRSEGGKGWVDKETGEPSSRPTSVPNKKLFDYLKKLEKQKDEDDDQD